MIDISLTKVSSTELSPNRELVSIAPLPPGFGMTLGNAFRRVLLSSLPGAAVTGIKIEGVSHEFSTIPGIKEGVIDIVLNLKGLRMRKYVAEPITLKLSTSKVGAVQARDIEPSSEVEIVNPEMVICTISKKVKLDMLLYIESGMGYVPAHTREKRSLEPGVIAVDALFSPVKKVRYEVSNTRVGQMTDLDKLDVEIETDGTVSPKDIMSYSAQVLSDYSRLLNFSSPIQKVAEAASDAAPTEAEGDRKYTPVETLKISPRTLNALINNGIGSVEQLIDYSPKHLSSIKGFGKKAMNEVEKALKNTNKTLRQE